MGAAIRRWDHACRSPLSINFRLFYRYLDGRLAGIDKDVDIDGSNAVAFILLRQAMQNVRYDAVCTAKLGRRRIAFRSEMLDFVLRYFHR